MDDERRQWLGIVCLVWAVLIVLLILLLGSGGARGQAATDPLDCSQLARLVARVATYRDVDANEAKVIARVLALNTESPAMHREAIAREIRRLWRDKLPIEDAVVSVYVRCTKVLGDMGGG